VCAPARGVPSVSLGVILSENEAVSGASSVEIGVCDPREALARGILWAYLDDVISSYHRRPASASEIRSALNEFPSDDLVWPTGWFWVARVDGRPVGCVGLRVVEHTVGEVTRLYVLNTFRRRGCGSHLMTELEHQATANGFRTLRLDTRDDLLEARALYAGRGYTEVGAFNDGPYADHWFASEGRQR
jgi:ribosomal protein S18 acetylase RimI-like enzyme